MKSILETLVCADRGPLRGFTVNSTIIYTHKISNFHFQVVVILNYWSELSANLDSMNLQLLVVRNSAASHWHSLYSGLLHFEVNYHLHLLLPYKLSVFWLCHQSIILCVVNVGYSCFESHSFKFQSTNRILLDLIDLLHCIVRGLVSCCSFPRTAVSYHLRAFDGLLP